MAKTSKYKVGDKVFLTFIYHRNSEPREVEVTKVGRKYVYVQTGSSDGYDIETGRQAGEWSGASYIMSPEGYARSKRAAEVEKALREWGVDCNGKARQKLIEVYEAVRPIFEET